MRTETPPGDVDRFLDKTRFSGYQAVPLPHGRRVPGKDRAATADIVFGRGVEGKSVLDIGTYYGFFCADAIRRGATDAVGLEPDAERYDVARRIADLNGGRYRVVHATAEEFRSDRTFDVVLALNVLHHVLDPVAFVSHIARFCSETLVVEFRLPEDPGFVESVLSGGNRVGLAHRALARGRSAVLRAAGRGLPLMAVGNRPYHRVFYFTREAFTNLFMVHLGLFREVGFATSPGPGRRAVAFCRIPGR